MKSDIEQLKKRGYIEDEALDEYRNFSKSELIDLLLSKIPSERTIAARLLPSYDDIEVLKALIESLVNEKKLYTKIALSEGISSYGEDAGHLLITYLGKIGSNQHRVLPDKPFQKKSYPLPRDIIARTMCKIGKSALNALKYCLNNGEYIQILEAVDAIGFISYYESNTSLQEDILEQIELYKEDNLMIWKLLRTLQSFDDKKVVDLLKAYQTSYIPQHKWEATRSLEQIIRRKQL